MAVGSWCCKIAGFLCNVREFSFCLMEGQHVAPFNESTAVVAIVMEQDINRIRHTQFLAVPVCSSH